jgi:hemoglobin/transferrin/lactoferrin receptor protein
MKQYFTLCLFLMSAVFTMAQTITIKSIKTDENLELVTLMSEKPNASAMTNANGQVDISAFKGAAHIKIRLLGYQSLNISYQEIIKANLVVFLEPSNYNLDEVVVSATRWKQTTGNVPSKITSIDINEVAFQNPQTAADMLAVSGKVFIQKSQQGGGSPMIRGFATNRLLYTVDGVRMNTAIFRGGNIQNVISLDPFAMENVEVLFGPGSTIYGSDAIGGVMSFQTLTPQLSLNDEPLISGKALARYSSANREKTGHFDVNVGWKKWAIATSVSSWNYDNLKQGSHGPDDYIKDYYVQRQDSVDVVVHQNDPLLQIPSAYSQMNLMQKVRFKPNENWDFEYGFHYSETSPYGRYDRNARMRNGTARYAEWNYGPQKWLMNNLAINQHGDYAIYDQLTVRLAQQSFEESRIDRSLNSNDRNTNTENVEAYSANLDLVKSIGENHTLFYGAEYVLNDVKSKGEITDISTGDSQVGPARYPISSWTSMAVYLNDEYRLSRKVSLQGGLRYSYFILDADFSENLDFYPFSFSEANINNGALTGSIGGVYRPNYDLVVKANFGTAFRAPNVDDIGKIFDSEPGAVTIPNPNLEAEYAYSFDVGIAKVFGDIVELDLSAYYTILQNAMVRRNDQLNGMDSIMYDGMMSQVQTLQNAAKANVYGIQADIEIKLSGGFMFTSDLNYQKGEEELDDGSISSSRHAAPLFGTSSLNYKRDKLHMQFYAVYQGEKSYEDLPDEEKAKDEIYAKDADGNNYAPAWYTLNFKANYHFNETFSLMAGLENISDQRYRPYSSGISGAGRNFIMSLTFNF